MIDRETQQRIKDAANIVEVVGDYVKLTRKGASYMGLCPFHNERTPSFSVNPRGNYCHCFSCRKGGSPVNFIMEKEGISYTEALLLLAKKYNIPVREKELSDEERARMSEREALMIANEWAMNIFHSDLYGTDEGRDIGLQYLYSRGVTDEAIKKFKIGYAIDRGDYLISKAKKEGFDLEVLKTLGLTGTSQSGRDYDKFRGRIIFPIRNTSGKTVAFGGRALKGESAKYINSPESLLYKKSNELYGIYESKPDIIKENKVFLMEGYLDVTGSWQSGLRNVVASSGTSLTENQIAHIHRFTDNVTLIYDGDNAGIKASLRGIDMLLAQKLHVKVLLLPEGEDPDSFAKRHTPEEFRQYIRQNESDFIHYQVKVLLNNAKGNPQQIAEAVRNVVRSIASIPDEIERISYIKECARMFDIEERIISKQVSQALLQTAANSSIKGQNFNSSLKFSKQEDNIVEKKESSGDSDSSHNGIVKVSSFFMHEKQIIKYCMKYGMLRIQDSTGTEKYIIDYVGDEMEADGITFTHSGFQKIFDSLHSQKDSFHQKFATYSEEVESRLKETRKEFREKLRLSGGSLSKLKTEEEKFEVSEKEMRESLLRQFAMNFSVSFIINHEDNEIRETANPLIADRHVLSSIYNRQGVENVSEDGKLSELVPRAISELRSEILNGKVTILQQKVAEAIADNNVELQMKYMSQLSKILYMRSCIAENLGERIISPR